MSKRLLVLVGMTVLLLVGGELALRAWAGFFRHSYQRYDPQLGMIALVPNYDAITYGDRIRINALGLRGGDVSPTKRPGTYRIIMIGDSSTFGGSGDECHYPRQLQRLLDARAPQRYEVINAGVEGYDSDNAVQLLERKLLNLQPDLLTVYIGWNDLIKRDPMRADPSAASRWLAFRLYDVYLIKLWRKLIYAELRPMLLSVGYEISPDEVSAYQRYVPSGFEHNLVRMAQLAHDKGVRIVFFTLPSPLKANMTQEEIAKLYFPYYTYNLKRFYLAYTRYNETIKEAGRIQHVPVVDLASDFLDKSYVFWDTSHPTCDGKRAIAEAILHDLTELGVIPGA